MASPHLNPGQAGLSQAELARRSGLSQRTIRVLIGLGAIDRAHAGISGKQMYSLEHLREARRANLLIGLGLIVHHAAALCCSIRRLGRVRAGMSLPDLKYKRGHQLSWETDGVRIEVAANCNPEAERLVAALRSAIDQTRGREKDLRRKLRAFGP